MFDKYMINEYREYEENNEVFREYKIYPEIAELIKKLRLGLSGYRQHSYEALSIAMTGCANQVTGYDLCRIAQWTLGENWDD